MMNIAKLILIDAFLAISTIPLIYLIKSRKKESLLFRAANKEEILEKTYINLPDKTKLLELEKLAMRKGNDFEFDWLG